MLKLSYSNAEFKKFPGDNTPDPRFKGEENLFSFSENVPKLSCCNSNAEFKNFPGDKTPDLCFRGRKVCFRSPKMYQNSPTAMKYSNFHGDNTPDPRFRGQESLFSFSENVLKLSYSNAEFKNYLGDNTPEPRFRGEGSLFLFSENVPKLSYSNFQRGPGVESPDPRFWGREVKVASSWNYVWLRSCRQIEHWTRDFLMPSWMTTITSLTIPFPRLNTGYIICVATV